MTLPILFNKGIYKSTVKRYLWGSLVYFILLFVSTTLNLLMTFDFDRAYHNNMMDYYKEIPLILRSQYTVFPILMAIVIPTIVALLIFRFVHSKKAAVFTHCIPATRTSIYVSSLAAAFTLMFVPVILNTFILMIVSVCGFGEFFGISACLKWMGINLFSLFLMFSCAVFSAMITGNSFAVVVINILVHSFILIIVGGFTVIANAFLYGFSPTNDLIEKLFNNNFACVVFSMGTSPNFREGISFLTIVEFLLASAVFYIVSLVLYKKRQLENAEDIAGFKCLNHIFKYLVTFIVTIGAFAMFSYYLSNKAVIFTVIVLIASLVSYFGCEMLLKKALNVFGSYKGYIFFAVLFILCIGFFAATSFFGYETYLPESSEIESASFYNYYYAGNEPEFTDNELIDLTLKTHKELISPENIYTVSPNNFDTRLYIKYTLKNGKEISRVYQVKDEIRTRVMTEFYKYDNYKMKCEEVFVPAEAVTNIEMHVVGETQSKVTIHKSIEADNYTEFMKTLQKDVLELDYNALHHPQIEEDYKNSAYISFNIRFTPQTSPEDMKDGAYAIRTSMYITINKNYKNTIDWLIEKGCITVSK